MWGTALTNLKAMYPKYACKEFNEGLAKFNFRSVPLRVSLEVMLLQWWSSQTNILRLACYVVNAAVVCAGVCCWLSPASCTMSVAFPSSPFLPLLLTCLRCCREDEVPQLQDISDALKAATGWQVCMQGQLAESYQQQSNHDSSV